MRSKGDLPDLDVIVDALAASIARMEEQMPQAGEE
jgi:hypothetical protein